MTLSRRGGLRLKPQLKQEDGLKFKASLNYIVSCCFRKIKWPPPFRKETLRKGSMVLVWVLGRWMSPAGLRSGPASFGEGRLCFLPR